MKCDIVLVIQVHILDQTCSRTCIGETVMINRYEEKKITAEIIVQNWIKWHFHTLMISLIWCTGVLVWNVVSAVDINISFVDYTDHVWSSLWTC